MNTGALEDITVLDLTRVFAGPFSTMMMADMGANVIKIEIPGRGDDTRGFAPFKNGESTYFANVNRNKKGMTLNLKSDEGRQLFYDMVKKADVVVENFRPGVMKKLGIDYDTLSEINDKIIVGSVSGFGQYGPYKDRPGYDIIAQAMGGLMSITGWDEKPTRVGSAMGDVLGGLSVTIGILAAVNAVKLTGKGQHVDVSLVDSVVASLETGVMRYLASEEEPEKMGNRYASAYPYDSFTAKDGDYVIGCGSQKLFELLCNDVLDAPELVEDPRFTTNLTRIDHHKELKKIIDDWSSNYTIEECVGIVLEAGVPAAPINTMEQVIKDKHIAGAREMFPTVHHPIIGEMKVNGAHIKLSKTKPEVKEPAPLLGQHNQQVLSDMLGLSDEEIEELKKQGII